MKQVFKNNKWLLVGLGFASLFGCSSVAPVDNTDTFVPDDPSLLLRPQVSTISSWTYQLQNYTNRLTNIKNSGFQMAVVDYSSDGSAAGKWTRTEVSDAKSNKQLLAYLSVGEAEDFRYYWSSAWKVGNPAWITAASPKHPGQYLVQYSNAQWQGIILGYLDKIITQGFDGAYLDTVDVYKDLGATATQKTQMIDWVCQISQYAKAKNPNFKIITQNASDLIWANNGALGACIDATAQEGTWFGATDIRTLDTSRTVQLKDYAEFKRLGKPVFTLDFSNTSANIAEAYTKARANGLVEYVTDENLDVLRVNPGFDPAPGTTPIPTPTPTPNPTADLSLTGNATPNPVAVGANLSYNFTVKNTGPDAASSLKFTDKLPASTALISSTTSQGTCSLASGTLSCALGNLALNAAAQVTVVLTSSLAGTLTNTASVSATETDPVITNNALSLTTTIQTTPTPTPTPTPTADLGITGSSSVTTVKVGTNFSHNFTVKNSGPNTASSLKFTDKLPANASYVSSSTNQGTCSVATGTLTCVLGNLAFGATAQVSLVLSPTAAGIVTNSANVSATETDPVTANNTSSVSTTVETIPTPTPTPTPGTIKLPPTGKISWDWQIGASGDSNVVVPSGAVLMDLDGFNISAAKIASLKAQGIYTVCYLDVGSWEAGRPDSDQYPAYLKIQKDPNWPEYFLDINDVWKPNSVLATILKNRFKMCADKGFDAIEPDNLQNDENVTGGLITTQNQIDFNGWVADNAHAYNLAVFQKNGPDKILLKDKTGKMMVEKFDAILNEECQQYNECAPLAEYVKRGKLALNVEYSVAVNCTTSNSLVINSIRKDLNLTGGNMSGYKREFCI